MDKVIKIGIALLILTVGASAVLLKPLITNENDYKVIMVNLSEHDIASVRILGSNIDSGLIGPIKPGKLRHYIFRPAQSGKLEYIIIQDNQEFKGIINENLGIGETGEVYVVMREMHKVKIQDELNI